MSALRTDSLFVAVVNCASEAILGFDNSGTVVIANPAAERMFGYEGQGMAELPLSALIPEGVRPAHDSHHKGFFANPRARKMAEGKALLARRRDGSLFPVEVSLGYAETDAGPIAISIATDVTETVKGRQQLQFLTQRLLAAEEAERRRLAMELHDGLSQRLAAISLRLSFLAPDLPAAQADQLTEVRKMVEQANEELRVLSHGMYPSLLNYSGLIPALEQLIEESQSPNGPVIEFTVRMNRDDIPVTTATVLYRIAQESLHNALKHARSSNIHVGLEESEDRIILWVTDDGDGFDPAASSHGGSGLGLLSMRERALGLGGSFRVQSEPGGGSRIKVELPLLGEGKPTIEDQLNVTPAAWFSAEETSHS